MINLRNLFLIILFLIVIVGGVILLFGKSNKTSVNYQIKPTANQASSISEESKLGNMKLTSSVFQSNQSVPAKFTCDGENVNPPLTISDTPGDAKSIVLIMDDPDAPSGTWVHWTLWNIDPNTKEIAENSLARGAIEGITSFGKPGYGGPCPPSGTHHYHFKLYALDTTLSLSSSASREDLEKSMKGHIISKSELVGLYSHK